VLIKRTSIAPRTQSVLATRSQAEHGSEKKEPDQQKPYLAPMLCVGAQVDGPPSSAKV